MDQEQPPNEVVCPVDTSGGSGVWIGGRRWAGEAYYFHPHANANANADADANTNHGPLSIKETGCAMWYPSPDSANGSRPGPMIFLPSDSIPSPGRDRVSDKYVDASGCV